MSILRYHWQAFSGLAAAVVLFGVVDGQVFVGDKIESPYDRDTVAAEHQLKAAADPVHVPSWDDSEESNAPLVDAVNRGDIEEVGRLLDQGADVDLSDGTGATPLQAAAKRGDVPMLRLLVKHMAHVDDGHNGSSALWAAGMAHNVDAFKYLLLEGANPNTTDGQNPAQTVLKAVDQLGYRDEDAMLRRAGAKTRI